jgi:hypothetical protein
MEESGSMFAHRILVRRQHERSTPRFDARFAGAVTSRELSAVVPR